MIGKFYVVSHEKGSNFGQRTIYKISLTGKHGLGGDAVDFFGDEGATTPGRINFGGFRFFKPEYFESSHSKEISEEEWKSEVAVAIAWIKERF